MKATARIQLNPHSALGNNRPSRPLRGYESTLTVYAPKLKEWDTTSSILSSVTVRMKMGLLSVYVGMGATGAGFAIDVEVAIESGSVPLEHEENAVTPAILVHGEEEQKVNSNDDDDGPPNIDNQKAVAQAVCRFAAVASPASAAAGEVNVSRHDVSKPASVIAKPLFRVVDVEFALRGLKIDQSRHTE